MKARLITLFALAWPLFSSTATATPIEVIQGGVSLGVIEPYTGATTANGNWTNNGGAAIGPAELDDRGNIFFYDGADGLTFVISWNNVASNPGSHRAFWDIDVSGNTANSQVRISDDNSIEFTEQSPDYFRARWGWGPYVDGGGIGDLVGSDWEITIDPLSYQSIAGLDAYGVDGTIIPLSLNTNQDIVLRLAQVPSTPATFGLLLLGVTAIGFAGRKP